MCYQLDTTQAKGSVGEVAISTTLVGRRLTIATRITHEQYKASPKFCLGRAWKGSCSSISDRIDRAIGNSSWRYLDDVPSRWPHRVIRRDGGVDGRGVTGLQPPEEE